MNNKCPDVFWPRHVATLLILLVVTVVLPACVATDPNPVDSSSSQADSSSSQANSSSSQADSSSSPIVQSSLSSTSSSVASSEVSSVFSASTSSSVLSSSSESSSVGQASSMANHAIEIDTKLLTRIEAEDYQAAFDLTSGNQGMAYRANDVDIEPTKDIDGAFNIGWTESGEWLEYAIRIVEENNYQLSLRVASEGGAGLVTVELNGEVFGPAINISASGGWQNWQTITQPLGVLPAGDFTLRVNIQSGLFNLNWLALKAVGALESQCTQFEQGISEGNLSQAAGNEISGVISSRQFADVLWVHNDSGDAPRVMAVTKNGALRAQVRLTGITANDFEDIAIDANHRIYVGDIGDNPSTRDGIEIYRFAEPDLSAANNSYIEIAPERIRLRYPDGANNAETLLVDPITGDIYILTKTNSGNSVLYRAAAPLKTDTIVTLQPVQTIALPNELTTAGDISANGELIVVRTYGNLYGWQRSAGQSIASAMSTPPFNLPARAEAQGEAVGFAADGLSYFTISEGNNPPIYQYRCRL